MATGYTCAKDLFDAARDAALDREAATRQLAHLDSRRFSMERRTDGTPSAHTATDGIGASVAFLDFEAAVRRRLAEDDEVLKLATAVLYGSDGDSGASSLVSGRHADVVFNRYVRPHAWNKAAAICNVAPATARRMASELFDIVDAYGIERAIEGAGIA